MQPTRDRRRRQAIVTFNLKDFPPSVLSHYGIEALHPDDYVLDLIDLAPGAVFTAVTKQASALRNPPMTVAQVLDLLRALGLVGSVAKLRSLLAEPAGTRLRGRPAEVDVLSVV